MKSNLPAGWSIVKIGDILSFSGGGTPSKHVSKFWNGDISWASVKDVKGKYLTKTQDTITKAGLDASATQLAEPGTVLMVTRMAPGRPIITQVQTAINQDLKIVRPKLPISPLFIYYAFLNYERKFLEIASGTTVQGIRVEDIKEIEIPFPPLAEQHRIVAQLEAIMQKLDASQERLEKLPVLLKKFRQAVLAAAVSGKLTEAWRAEQTQGETATELLSRIQKERREWAIQEARKGNLEASRFYKKAEAQSVSSIPDGLPEGWSCSSLLKVSQLMVDCHNKTAPYISEGVPLVRTTNIKNGRLLLDSVKYVSPETYRFWSKRCPPKPGDILFTREAPMGESAIIPPDTTLCMGQRMMLLRFFKDLSDVQFFGYVIQSPAFLSQLGESAVGTGVLHLRVGDVEALQVPVPPIAEQHEIARQVKHYFDLADQLEARFEQAAAMVEQLPQALLAKAFSGQLVPQDPNDEHASAFLERLQTSAVAPVKGQRGRKPKDALATPLFN